MKLGDNSVALELHTNSVPTQYVLSTTNFMFWQQLALERKQVAIDAARPLIPNGQRIIVLKEAELFPPKKNILLLLQKSAEKN